MTEGEKYSGMKTEIELIFEGKNLGKITVPFSADEVARIEKMREAHKSLSKEAMRGSGVIRELYLNGGIPWGYTLQNRGKSIQLMEEALRDYDNVMNEERFSRSLAPFLDQLEEISNGLRSFTEDQDKKP